MKKIILLTITPFVFGFASLAQQITQTESDSILLKRMQVETREHIVYASSLQTEGTTLTTAAGEVLEWDFSCWIYYIHYADQAEDSLAIRCYFVVKESSGNLLEINTKNNSIPNNLVAWRIIPEMPESPFDSIVLIGKGNLSGDEGIIKQNLIITRQEDWENLKTTMNLVNNVTDSFADIDFSRYQIIALFDEIKLGECWTIDITDIIEDTDSIVVTYTNIGIGDSSLDIIQPCHIVKIPISDKQIVFQYKHHIVKVLDLNGNWVNEQQDTLLFYGSSILHYKPYFESPTLWLYAIKDVAEDSITIHYAIYGTPPFNIEKYYFKYSLCKETETIEIHGFQGIGCAFYRRIKQ